MNIDEAYAAGRATALRGEAVTSPPLPDDLFLAWIRGYREHQAFDPSCAQCRGTGRRRAGGEGPYSSCELICYCNVARNPTQPKPHDHATALVDALTHYVASEPSLDNLENLRIAKAWLEMLLHGHSDGDARRLLAELDALPVVGSITCDLQLACDAWLKRAVNGEKGGGE